MVSSNLTSGIIEINQLLVDLPALIILLGVALTKRLDASAALRLLLGFLLGSYLLDRAFDDGISSTTSFIFRFLTLYCFLISFRV